jgi:translocator protein
VLYIMIAVAGWRVWVRRDAPWARTALAVWAVQLVLNAVWSWLFFGLHMMLLALADIALLLATIIGFIVVTWRHDRVAAGLFVPYFAWVAFATALNASLWWLNR